LLTVRPLGSVSHITRSNYIIVKLSKSNELPHIGVDIVDANNEVVGKLIDIIGPITQPFAVVRPIKPAITSFLKPSTFLFYRLPRKGYKKGKRHELQ